MSEQKSLDTHQLELVNIIKIAHSTLSIARKVRAAELDRRVNIAKLDAERALEQALAGIRIALDAEIAVHESALDESLIAAYNANVPIRRIALTGFGNRYDGAVHQLISKLRTDGRVGNRVGYQINGATSIEDSTTRLFFPEPVDIDGILNDASTIAKPIFAALPDRLIIVEADPSDPVSLNVTVQAVRLEMDARDPWFRSIAKNARPGTPHLTATSCTLYRHPATGQIVTHESRESGAVAWDHPVARWVVDNYSEAAIGFDAATLATSEAPE